MRTKCRRISWLVIFCALLMGCSEEDASPGGPDSNLVSVTGNVTRIEDNVPSDGGVFVELQLDNRTQETLYLPSFFTYPPPPEEQQQVYQVISQLEIGDRVYAEGERTDSGIKLKKLTILNGKKK